MNDASFDAALGEMMQIMNQGEAYPVVRHLGITFIYELDARMHGGYTEAGRDKLMAIIREEGEE